ncbi:topology modulation protein [Sutcliffiella horikoshii]|uniref:topology modulation protein n=1 Tax=Sutcliffiella horikoshii TaxID=79883 RepID=UPI001F1E6775|nr:topology modulation protein [Sutcliffiella horikoshii]MCG1023689.1 topology modulation protein [Sutcliffiella horikoshii]
MKRIMVIGASAGAGKSTFATRLGKALNINVFHLDAFFWKPGWVEASKEEFTQAQQEMIKNNNSWIVEGNYTATFDIRAEKADTIIYLELPLRVCLYRVIKRWLTNLGKRRPDLGGGCTERMEWAFIKFIITTYRPRKKAMKERLDFYQEDKLVVRLKGKAAIEYFLQAIEQTKSSSAS